MARTSMPRSIEELEALVAQQREALEAKDAELAAREAMIEERDALLAIFREWKRLLDSQRFGARSERFASDAQARLFDEAEAIVAQVDAEASPEDVAVPAHTRRRRRPRTLPDFLPVQEVLHDLSEEEKVCPHDASHRLAEIGREQSDQLRFIPATVEIVRHIRPRYACKVCKEGVRIAPMPKLPVPKSLATPSLLAQVATSKYVDGLPLYRQEKIFARLGLDISRATLAHWMVRMGELVEPLVERMREEVRGGDLVLCDETPFQVLKEPGKAAQSSSYLWVLRGGEPAHPLLLYEYDPSRSGEVPKRLLRGFRGYLQTDGYEGYGAIGREPGVVHVGCWAHARRKFDEALRGQRSRKSAKKTPKQSKARQALARIQELYRIERSLKDASPEVRQRERQKRSGPVMEKLRAWLDVSIGSVPPQSLTGKAMAYLDRQWPRLVRVLDDGRLPLDTNLVENAIRPFVVGRKNWLFADTPAGARASANLYSLIETAKANRLEPWRYLNHLFEVLPGVEGPDELESLLPRNLDPEAIRPR
jgi:transposase